MAQTVQNIMNRNPKTLPKSASVIEAANVMCDANIGDVIVTDEGDKIFGIVTDRDIVVRAIAQGKDPMSTKLEEVTSKEMVTVALHEKPALFLLGIPSSPSSCWKKGNK